MTTRFAKAVVFSLAALAVAACGDSGERAQPAAGDEPHSVVVASAEALKANDVETFLETMLPQSELARMQAQWQSERESGFSADEAADLDEALSTLTAPDAEQQLMAQIEPQLEKMRPQVPLFVGMFQGLAQQGIADAKDMTEAEKAEAKAAVSSLAQWAKDNDIASAERAREAIAIACETARNLGIEAAEELKSKSFSEMLQISGRILAGFKDIGRVYGMDFDKMLDSLKAETVERDGDRAVVKVSMRFLGSERTFKTPMAKVDGRWVSQDAAEQAAQARKAGLAKS